MRSRIIYLALLVCCLSFNAFAQSKPGWIVSFENTIKQKEKAWKIDSEVDNSVAEEDAFNYSFALKSGNYRSNIRIARLPVSNLEETFGGFVIAFENTMGKKSKKVQLENYGDEGFIWNVNKEGWTMIMFRKADIFVDIYAPSEKTARKFADYVIEQMP